MTSLQEEQLTRIFSALSDPTRRAILAQLSRGEATVAELAEPFDVSMQSISKHVGVLESAGLISRGRDAQRRPSMIRLEPLQAIDQWLGAYRQLWQERLGNLDRQLAMPSETKR